MTASLMVLPSAVAEGPNASDIMLFKINQFRRVHGLRPLHAAQNLKHSAYAFSRELMRTDRFGHASHIKASGHYRRLGEILAIHSGREAAVDWTLAAWAASPEHRAILLSRHFSSIGLGRTYGRFQGHRANIWVGQLGHR
jgi:uncharacterized protein YkwD